MIARIPEELKKQYMKEWWSKAHDLLVETKMKRSDIVDAVAEIDVKIRDNGVEMMEYCRDHNIPLLLFSAGLGDVLKVRKEMRMDYKFLGSFSSKVQGILWKRTQARDYRKYDEIR